MHFFFFRQMEIKWIAQNHRMLSWGWHLILVPRVPSLAGPTNSPHILSYSNENWIGPKVNFLFNKYCDKHKLAKPLLCSFPENRCYDLTLCKFLVLFPVPLQWWWRWCLGEHHSSSVTDIDPCSTLVHGGQYVLSVVVGRQLQLNGVLCTRMRISSPLKMHRLSLKWVLGNFCITLAWLSLTGRLKGRILRLHLCLATWGSCCPVGRRDTVSLIYKAIADVACLEGKGSLGAGPRGATVEGEMGTNVCLDKHSF